jgi:hypothetical protein
MRWLTESLMMQLLLKPIESVWDRLTSTLRMLRSFTIEKLTIMKPRNSGMKMLKISTTKERNYWHRQELKLKIGLIVSNPLRCRLSLTITISYLKWVS